MKTRNKIRKKFYVPLYNVWVLVIVCDNADKEIYSNGSKDYFSGYKGFGKFKAIQGCKDFWNYAIVFERKAITEGIVAHEIFHLTLCIFEYYLQTKYKNKIHYEQGAMLCQYLTEKTLEIIKK